jgi:hypothetical protein
MLQSEDVLIFVKPMKFIVLKAVSVLMDTTESTVFAPGVLT